MKESTKNPVDYCISYTSLQDFYISYIAYISYISFFLYP